jgi:ribose transport system substrate-binding protein
MSLKSMLLAAGVAVGLMSGTALAAGPETVAGPGADPQCFVPWSDQTTFFQWPAKEGPYRIAVVNGFVGNVWRILMILTATAFS